MILNTGSRTDIPAFYSKWFYNRVKEGFVCTRNPYNPKQVRRYQINPDVVDILSFCTKNPGPMLSRIHELDAYRQFWGVTLTSYGKDIEPNVPDKHLIIKEIQALSNAVGRQAVSWRYDPIFITEKYAIDYHLRAFETICNELQGYISFCVISFIDLYAKTKRNFPDVQEVSFQQQAYLAERMSAIASAHGIPIRACCESQSLQKYGIITDGCMTRQVLEEATGCHLTVPKGKTAARAQCTCLLGDDIGMYNTCGHGCLYCYANYDNNIVKANMAKHDPDSPFLIGNYQKDDIIIDVDQKSWVNRQLSLF
ncbi:MAG: DUF1848 domain-containing protein [Lactimicrobium sp.]|jgi:hypothetical protein|uniref:DUF1848 domain-containing protein n=1 Tax=Lactimicrobium sp. TaxID=2563780 RepID=UPI002F355A23